MYLGMRAGWIAAICTLVLLAGCGMGDGPAAAGRKAPTFALRDLQDEEVRLVEVLARRPALLVFWTTRCGYCKAEIPALNRLQGKYGENVSILAIDIGESKNGVSSFAKAQGITYRVLLDPYGEVARLYGVRAIPTQVLIDREGTIRYNGHGLEEATEQLLALPAGERTDGAASLGAQGGAGGQPATAREGG